MSLENGYLWSHQDIQLKGYSLAGISTSVAFPLADVCFDVAQGLPFQLPISNILLTHGHMDHAGGLPYLLGQKAMRVNRPSVVYMPPELVDPLAEIMALWGKIEGHSYNFTFRPIRPGEEAPLKGNYFFRPFRTFHRVPSQGYTVFQRRKRLRPGFVGLGHEELGRKRRAGEDLEETYEDAVVSFTGDTQIEFLENADVRRSRVLVMEATYWDEKKGIAAAREWGHIHFDELLPRLDELSCEKIVLIHSSARYSPRMLEHWIAERVPDRHRGRVELFPRPN